MRLGPRQSTRVTVTDVLAAMREGGIAGIEVSGDDIRFHHESGLTVSADELP